MTSKGRISVATLAVLVLAALFFASRKDVVSPVQENGALQENPSKGTSAEKVNRAVPITKSALDSSKKPLDQSYAYSAANDLRAYVDALQAEGKDAKDVTLAKAQSLEECGAIQNPATYVSEIVDQRKLIGQEKSKIETASHYAARSVQRCASYATRASRGGIEQLYAQAAQEGSTQARARKLKGDVLFTTMSPDGNSATSADFLPVALNLIESQDPSTILELSDLMGESSTLQGEATGSAKAAAAWKLVACDLGLDCSYGSALLRQYCLTGGMYCGEGDLRTNMMNGQFSPEEFSMVQQLEGRIYKAITTGQSSTLFNG